MARPKKKAAPKAEAKTIAFRSSAKYAEWLERMAKIERCNVATFLEKAAVEYVKSRGIIEEAPER